MGINLEKKAVRNYSMLQKIIWGLLAVLIASLVFFPVIMIMLDDDLLGWSYREDYIYYYYAKGKYYSNCTTRIGDDFYRFDKEGHCYINRLYEDEMGRKYYYDETGAMVHDQWIGANYFLEDGRMARSQYVDRIWIGYDSKWAGNRFDEFFWRVDGKWKVEDGKCYFLPDTGEKQLIDFSKVSSISIRGGNTGASEDPPLQSIVAYEEAVDNGFDVLLCDLRFTSDDVPVCFHESNINSIARKPDGSELGDTKVAIAKSSLKELEQYDFGIYKGDIYKGTKLLTLQKLLDFSKDKPIKGVYVVVSDVSDAQIAKAVALSKQYDVKVSWICSSLKRAKAVIKSDPSARVALPVDNISKSLPDLISLQTKSNEVFIYGSGKTLLDSELVQELKDNNIAFEMGYINSPEAVVRYWNGAYAFCSGIASDRLAVSQIDVEAVVRKLQGE